MTREQAIQAWLYVEQLRMFEGDDVLIISDNGEGPPNSRVECSGAWTAFEPKTFDGVNVFACLQAAAEEHKASYIASSGQEVYDHWAKNWQLEELQLRG